VLIRSFLIQTYSMDLCWMCHIRLGWENKYAMVARRYGKD
jgi:hypothetical protein